MTTNIVSNTPLNEKNEWLTPPEVFAWARKLLGGIDFDTACCFDNALAEPIWWLGVNTAGDALKVDWYGRCWCNPPYNKIEPWIEKALASDAITAMLIPSPNGESRYGQLMQYAHEVSIVGRLAFLKPDGTPVSGNTRGSSLFIINGYGQGTRSFVERDAIYAQYSQVTDYIRGKVEVRS